MVDWIFQVHAICHPCENHLQKHLYTPAIEFNRISDAASKAIGEHRLDAIRYAREACMKHIYYKLLPSCPSRHAVISLIPQDCIPYVSIFPGTQGARVSLADLCELQTRHIQLAMEHVEQLLRNHVTTCPHCVAVVRQCSADTSCTLRPTGATASSTTATDSDNTRGAVAGGTGDLTGTIPHTDADNGPYWVADLPRQSPARAHRGVATGASPSPDERLGAVSSMEACRAGDTGIDGGGSGATGHELTTTPGGTTPADGGNDDGLVTPAPMSPPATPDTSMLQAHYNQLRHDLMNLSNLSNLSNFSAANTSGGSVLDHVGFPLGVSPATVVPNVEIDDDIVICRTCAKFCHRACFRSAEAQCLRCVYFRPDVIPALMHFPSKLSGIVQHSVGPLVLCCSRHIRPSFRLQCSLFGPAQQ